MKKAFTVVEMLISTIIIWLISIVIFRVYITIMNISSRIENEKIINTEFLFVSQSVQNLAEKANIDYEKYDSNTLFSTNWFVQTLYLTWEEWTFSVYLTGECGEDLSQIRKKNCWIQLDKNGDKIDLTDKNKIYITKFYFKLLPYDDIKKYNLSYNDTYQNGFWIFAESYIKKYSEINYPFKVKFNYQNFYNIRKYDF